LIEYKSTHPQLMFEIHTDCNPNFSFSRFHIRRKLNMNISFNQDRDIKNILFILVQIPKIANEQYINCPIDDHSSKF
jgi:hypothetical protein